MSKGMLIYDEPIPTREEVWDALPALDMTHRWNLQRYYPRYTIAMGNIIAANEDPAEGEPQIAFKLRLEQEIEEPVFRWYWWWPFGSFDKGDRRKRWIPASEEAEVEPKVDSIRQAAELIMTRRRQAAQLEKLTGGYPTALGKV